MGSRLEKLTELSPARVRAWEELAEAAVEPNAFFAPEFVVPAATGLRENDLALAFTEEGGEMLAAMPVKVGRWRGRVPAVSAWCHRYGFLGVPLVRDGEIPRRVAELVHGAVRGAHRDLIALERLGDGPVSRSLVDLSDHTRLRAALRVDAERALLRRRAEPTYLADQAPHRRRELARQRRRLAEFLGEAIETVEAEPGAAAVDRFLELEASGWKGDRGTALASVSSHRRMFAELCRRFSSAGRLQLLEMRAGERLIAVKCNLRSAHGAFAFKIGFDEQLARFSPGVQLEVDNISFFHAGDAEFMDSCADPGNGMINRLWPDRRGLCSLVLAGSGLRGQTTRAALRVAGRVREHKERARA
ncbi:GNAT family N-acetyltransferase [Thermoleophilia bacterium SCSIO 60948]|nr:GNAT family N-acetyltransferase [Thermoleophilia bacterium SCSIO 60948]